jgi:hypothetical protein
VAKWLAATHADPLREIQKSVNTTLAIVSPGRNTNGFVRQVESSVGFFCFKQPSVSLPFFCCAHKPSFVFTMRAAT